MHRRIRGSGPGCPGMNHNKQRFRGNDPVIKTHFYETLADQLRVLQSWRGLSGEYNGSYNPIGEWAEVKKMCRNQRLYI